MFFDYGPKYSVFNTFENRTGEEIFFKEDVTKISVKTISLDDFCKNNRINPTFIKIDAEGPEYLILGAMNYILRELHPIVSIEVSSNKEWGDNLIQSFKTFEKHGYVSYEMTIDGMLNKCDPRETRAYDNLIFVHTSTIPKIEQFLL